MASINPNSPVPLYKQVLDILNDQIARQELKFGDKLPSEAELMKQFSGRWHFRTFTRKRYFCCTAKSESSGQ